MNQQKTTRKPSKAWRWLAEILLVVALIAGLHHYRTRDVVRGPAPAFGATLLDGSAVSLDDYRGRPLLLQFWATWCPVCRLEQGSIDALARDHQVLGVSIDDMPPEELQHWMDEQEVSWPAALDGDGSIARLYGVRGVPTSVIIDAAGDIRFVEVGYTSGPGLRFRLWWAGR